MRQISRLIELCPGIALAISVTGIALGIEHIQLSVFGHLWLDALVFAILLGTAINTAFGLPELARPGVRFASKSLLEVAIVLLGASISVSAFVESGTRLVLAVALVVVLSLLISYQVARFLGLSRTLSILIACGNSICGNSAIVAAAPVIGARPEDVTASVSFTAVLGILVVLLLPLVPSLVGMDHWQYGVVAGMTVYAVPQVLAATYPIGPLSVQIGTIVKLMRVVMLGPVVLLLSLRHGSSGQRPTVQAMIPWFILGFLFLMAVRSLNLIPAEFISTFRTTSVFLTVVSMAALGLSVDLRSVLVAGGRILAAGAVSLLMLFCLSWIALSFI